MKIHGNIIWLVVLYGLEIWPITLRKERRLSVFLNKVLRTRYGLWKDKVSRGWRKPRNKELHDFYSLSGFIRVIKRKTRWERHVVRIRKKKN